MERMCCAVGEFMEKLGGAPLVGNKDIFLSFTGLTCLLCLVLTCIFLTYSSLKMTVLILSNG